MKRPSKAMLLAIILVSIWVISKVDSRHPSDTGLVTNTDAQRALAAAGIRDCPRVVGNNPLKWEDATGRMYAVVCRTDEDKQTLHNVWRSSSGQLEGIQRGRHDHDAAKCTNTGSC
jgi:hypothetical protein